MRGVKGRRFITLFKQVCVLLVSDCRERLRRSLLYTPPPPPTSQQQWRQLTTWHCPHLLLRAVLRFGAATAERRRVIDRYLLLGSKPAAVECDGRMGQTYGRTPYRYIDPLSLPSRHTLLERSCVHNRMPVLSRGCLVPTSTRRQDRCSVVSDLIQWL